MITFMVLSALIVLVCLIGFISLTLIKMYFIEGREMEDEYFRWKYKYEFVFGRGGVYGIRKVYIFMGTK